MVSTRGCGMVARWMPANAASSAIITMMATAIVVALWLAFYLFVFLPRGALQ